MDTCSDNNRHPKSLEKIRFSITRLKLARSSDTKPTRLTWKDKILDYEIETVRPLFRLSDLLNLKR